MKPMPQFGSVDGRWQALWRTASNGLVADTFIPNSENEEVKALFQAGLKIVKMHENHAEKMVEQLG